jgi:hypothetical protein
MTERIADTDTVDIEGERLLILSPNPMPDWRVGGPYTKLAVHFRDRRYALVKIDSAADGYRYTLEPWPLVPNDFASREVVYDEAYVREREASVALHRKRRRQRWFLLPALPFVGFLPQRTKDTLQEAFGIDPVMSTQRSIVIEIAALGILFVFIVVRGATGLDWLTMQTGGGGEARDIYLFVALVLDLVFRGSIMVEDSYEPYGFLEWLAHPDLKEYARRIRLAYAGWRKRRSDAETEKRQ